MSASETGIIILMDNSWYKRVLILKRQVQTNFETDCFYFAHTANPSLRREPYCGCKLASISFSALCTRVSGYLRKLHTPASTVERSQRLGAGGVTGCKSYLLHPAKSPLTTTTTTTTSQGRRLRAKSEQPTAPLRGLLENLPTIQ